MKEISEVKIESTFKCEFCHRDFRRESTMLAHLCEPKRRYRERDEIGVKLGMQAYLKFYEIAQGSARLKTWDDFSSSSYYRAFVKFGRYCQSIKAVNYPALVMWLIRKNVPLDRWCQDRIYQDYLIQHTRQETVNDALARALESSIEWCERTGNPSSDYLRYGNDNVICHDITRGKTTAWAIYSSDSGQEFLDRINPDQVSLIWPWIDSDIWQKKFQDFPADQAYAQEILRQAGW
jgi:hypothetical protein